ncbi:MAG: CRISPR-associated endonuclease Cas2 [Candidatus Doudnabacteria bacterium CG10_big_fil_rev_8_21_14_0_10_42_18]|uniref:CRISPR-associated endonuclease Cas2 n=1 Tax=Candidatus Doudnabacteria bacterium CG10_big_fil_rev_8_21_14_0_10_42_18 TaxID=1974552 RepID=A0A2H0VBZ0_9BACT|nr:MAG: CRISPR-associated endonuclease Cas2 [Candidatus Doudnabacteria bacterium CG10_big_fil_rev_8_21_14_0_10_42_18]
MRNKGSEIVDTILEVLNDFGQILPRPFETKYGWARRLKRFGQPRFERGVRHLENRGLIEVVRKNDKKFIKLTKKGQLEILLKKAKKPRSIKWDYKWRIVMFDIPEDSADKRDQLRLMLKVNGFKKLQASVYINPYPLNREAVIYLKQTGLIEFIRILRVEEMDDDWDLKKKFKLT